MKQSSSYITPKHIYVLINENRDGYKDKILEAFNIKVNDEKISYNTSFCSIETVKNALSKEFDIIISAEQWKTIMPLRKIYGKRYRYVLQSGWTDIIAEKNVAATKILLYNSI